MNHRMSKKNIDGLGLVMTNRSLSADVFAPCRKDARCYGEEVPSANLGKTRGRDENHEASSSELKACSN
jgi:hypothetical protein